MSLFLEVITRIGSLKVFTRITDLGDQILDMEPD
jgi:hypothetical protein